MNTAERVLFLLKTRGEQSAQEIGEQLAITSMGARRQLEAWHEKGLVDFADHAEKQGRPIRRWHLTTLGHARFPDRHSELTVQLLQQVRELFGDKGIDKLINKREQQMRIDYQQALSKVKTLKAKVKALADIRSREGYMAQVEPHDDGGLLLIENHCPICAAANSCQDFCRSELNIFQDVLGDSCSVERLEHLPAGARRCVYWIKPEKE